MTYEDCMLAVLAHPEDDGARLDLANVLRKTDPEQAQFIEYQIAHANAVRATKYGPTRTSVDYEGKANWLLGRHEREWTRDLDFFMGENLAWQRNVLFHRGLPWRCSMNPYMFVEKGEYILSRVAPLRAIEFFLPPDEGPFPMKELAACPLLARLDQVCFSYEGPFGVGAAKPTIEDMHTFAASPHLERLRVLDVRHAERDVSVFEAFAKSQFIRQCFYIEAGREVAADGGPIGEFFARVDIYPDRRFQMSAEGRELERKYGYIPWLHKNNVCRATDAHYFVDAKVLPMFVPGSPADAPVPYGTGIDPWDDSTFEPRKKFAAASFDSW